MTVSNPLAASRTMASASALRGCFSSRSLTLAWRRHKLVTRACDSLTALLQRRDIRSKVGARSLQDRSGL